MILQYFKIYLLQDEAIKRHVYRCYLEVCVLETLLQGPWKVKHKALVSKGLMGGQRTVVNIIRSTMLGVVVGSKG